MANVGSASKVQDRRATRLTIITVVLFKSCLACPLDAMLLAANMFSRTCRGTEYFRSLYRLSQAGLKQQAFHQCTRAFRAAKCHFYVPLAMCNTRDRQCRVMSA